MKEEWKNLPDPETMKDPEPDYKLDNLYALCTAELTLQQTKRDQIIALFITICSFLIPTVFNTFDNLVRGISFFLLVVIGQTLCRVVVRYRVYKEVYWLASRVISRLMGLKKEYVCKAVTQQFFAENLEKAGPKTAVYKKDGDQVKPDLLATLKLHRNSAEFLLYLLLVLMTSVLLLLCILEFFLSFDLLWVGIVVAVSAFGAMFAISVRQYARDLGKVYQYCADHSRESFNGAYAKAWFLHMFG